MHSPFIPDIHVQEYPLHLLAQGQEAEREITGEETKERKKQRKRQRCRLPGTEGIMGLVPVAMRMWSALSLSSPTETSVGLTKVACPGIYSTAS